jgi:hypothetical protein
MFKLPHFAGGATPFRGNGSVPSIGGAVSLASALAAVERAEAALAAARALARSAAKREGVAVRGLFEDSRFMLRETGERWCDQARAEGEKVMASILSRSVSVEAADENSPFHHLAKRLMQPGALRAQQAEAAVPESHNLADAILKAAARAKTDGNGERPLPALDTVAGRILAAGTRARTPTGGHKDD